jgi:hypothetical protein
MAATNPAYACQGRTDHPAALFRMAQAGLHPGAMAAAATAPVGGVSPHFGSSLNVTGLASMNVTIGTGLVYMPNSTAWNGMYAGYNTATFTVAIAAASSTQWRTDLICATMTDPGDNTAAWNVQAVTGTNSSSSPGSTPSLPANSVPIALIRVTPSMTITTGAGTIVDNRAYIGLQGAIITTSSNRPPTSSPNGTTWYETDTKGYGVIINNAYQYIAFGSVAPDAWHTISLVTWTGTLRVKKISLATSAMIQWRLTGNTSGGLFVLGTLPDTSYYPTAGLDFQSTLSAGFVSTSGASDGSARLFIPAGSGNVELSIPTLVGSITGMVTCGSFIYPLD